MCLGVPMKVIEVDRYAARCAAKGIERTVSLLMIPGQSVRPGDYVLVHLGQAMQIMSEEEADQTWMLLDEMLALEDEARKGSEEPDHA